MGQGKTYNIHSSGWGSPERAGGMVLISSYPLWGIPARRMYVLYYNHHLLFFVLRLTHKTKQLEAEAADLEAKKVSVEEASQLAEEKFQKEMDQLKAQIGSLQSQVSVTKYNEKNVGG